MRVWHVLPFAIALHFSAIERRRNTRRSKEPSRPWSTSPTNALRRCPESYLDQCSLFASHLITSRTKDDKKASRSGVKPMQVGLLINTFSGRSLDDRSAFFETLLQVVVCGARTQLCLNVDSCNIARRNARVLAEWTIFGGFQELF